MTNKNLIALFLIIFMSSCTTGSITFQNLYTSLKPLINPDRSIPSQYDENFPYAYASLRVGRGQIIYVVLSEANNNILRWVSSDGFEINTINGKIISTNGFERNIIFHNPKSDLMLKNISELNYIASISSKSHDLFDVNVSIKRKKLNNFIQESFDVKSIKWKGKNSYYLDDNQRVIRSISEINPLLPKIEMQFYNLHIDH